MRLKDIYKTKIPAFSYEVFPPKDDTDGSKLEHLKQELTILKKYNPALISVTYGAGGSTTGQSRQIVDLIKNELNITPMPHFTCVSTDRKLIKDYIKGLETRGIENILALRGDIPENAPCCHDFLHATDLIDYIKAESSLSIAAAGYPEGHIESENLKKDIEYLKLKMDKGAEVIYTQLFFDNDKFFKFMDMCEKAHINIPIIPGILPITSYSQLSRMMKLCRVTIPPKLQKELEKNKENNVEMCGIEFAKEQCSELLKGGVLGIHFYTLNKSKAVSSILAEISQESVS